MATTVAATSSFTGIRLSDVYSSSGRVVARFDFGGKKAAKKPAEYLQYDLDSLDQNPVKNMASDIIGTWTEVTDIKPTPFQPYSKVFGLQRFRECELIHGRWDMLATLSALTIE
ncbi:chlorophyll a-b binding protein CP29.2, chloroplastic-like [Gossypium raimondii]|uniref:chlorophyll a-b binding protein CP29.2, chloroplastic-like n=1 Tax=Gossypium raimondii TaxID=29730 RepID=UPI00227BFEF1|nr:chlorophyll a-b binding protein CP29.2, chloroplastic-like [Gossypium raimondii]